MVVIGPDVLDAMKRAVSYAKRGDNDGLAEEIGCPLAEHGNCPQLTVEEIILMANGIIGQLDEHTGDLVRKWYTDLGLNADRKGRTGYKPGCGNAPLCLIGQKVLPGGH